jgi:hypothetical protein
MRKLAAGEKQAEWLGRKISRAENNPSNQSSNGIMFQSVALMIFILTPTLTFAAGNVASHSPRRMRESTFSRLLDRLLARWLGRAG